MVLRAIILGAILALAPGAASAAELTPDERAYVMANGPFTYCVDPDWTPYEIINSRGEHEGIAADLLRLAATRAGVPLRLVPTRDWDETIAASKEGRCQILSFLNRSQARDQWLIFTDPIFVDRNVIVTREDRDYIDDLAALSSGTVALPTGTSIEEWVRRDFPALTIVTTSTEAEAFAMVSSKRADMTIRSMMVAVFTIKKDGWFNLKVSGQIPGYENNLRIGIRNEHPLLRQILNKGVNEITPAERSEIANRHVSINVQYGIDYGLIAKIVGVFLAILLTNLFWLSKLRAVNRKLLALSLTDPLTLLANRASLNQRMEREYQRFQRYGTPFSVVLVDLDHFKRVNDELGHLMGDKMLVDFADIARTTVRAQDVVGRWGGEEFLILCTDTGPDQARIMAERLCGAVRGHAFESGRIQTISAGVATLSPCDSMDDVINRADQALYAAKEGGRDQVCAL